MGKMKVLFSSEDKCWGTPPEIFNTYNERFKFNTDVAALPESALCEHYYVPPGGVADYAMLWPGRAEVDGLKQIWRGNCWANPPYGRAMTPWVKKASQSRTTATTVMLLPARTDTRMFHELIWDMKRCRPRKGISVVFLKGRLDFISWFDRWEGEPGDPAPFPSMIVIFHKHKRKKKQ